MNRETYINQMRAYIGARDGNAKHKEIVDTYNSYLPHPRGYTLTINDPWCAATTSAAAIACGYADKIPIECSCSKIMSIAKSRGIWHDKKSYTPKTGDLVIFDWSEGKGKPNYHIGAVEKVENGRVYDAEGNYNENGVGVFKERSFPINWPYIHSYVSPAYDDAAPAPTPTPAPSEPVYYVVQKGDNLTKIATRYGTTVDAIMVLNPQIKNKNLIYTGQKIRVK